MGCSGWKNWFVLIQRYKFNYACMNTVISDLICLARYEILIQITTNIGQLQKWSSFDLCLGIKNETKYYGSSNKKATEFLFFFFSCFKFKMSFSQVRTYMVSYVKHQCSDTSQYNPHTVRMCILYPRIRFCPF